MNENKPKYTLKRILALVGICIMLGLIVLSVIAALSDWEDRDKIFVITAGATVVVPILIYGVMLFAKKREDENSL